MEERSISGYSEMHILHGKEAEIWSVGTLSVSHVLLSPPVLAAPLSGWHSSYHFQLCWKASGYYITHWQLGNFSSLFSLEGFYLWLWNSRHLSIIISTSNAQYTFLGTWNQLKSSSSVLTNSAFLGRTQTKFQRKDKWKSKPYWQPQIQCGLWLGGGLERS